MPRRGFVPKREVLPDPVYGTTIVTKLINQIMLDGKRGIAQSVCYDAFNMLAEKTGKDAMEVFNAALHTQKRITSDWEFCMLMLMGILILMRHHLQEIFTENV